MKIPRIDKDKCVACGNCEEICPEVFEVDDEGDSSHVIVDDFFGLEGCIEAAVENCPEDAITYEDKD
ncbi:MAG: ferredoxin [Thermoleophilia bacterium]|jgi:ferredoxin